MIGDLSGCKNFYLDTALRDHKKENSAKIR